MEIFEKKIQRKNFDAVELMGWSERARCAVLRSLRNINSPSVKRNVGLLPNYFVRAHTGPVFFLDKTLTHWNIFFLKPFSSFKRFRYAEKILKHATSAKLLF